MITIYTGANCPFCVRAKQLLESLGIEYKEVDVWKDPDLLKKISNISGIKSVPQIFVDEQTCLGGCDDLYELYAQGKLLSKLK